MTFLFESTEKQKRNTPSDFQGGRPELMSEADQEPCGSDSADKNEGTVQNEGKSTEWELSDQRK